MRLIAHWRSLWGAPPLDDALRLAIERGVALAEPLMRAVPRYQQKLADGVRAAVGYCSRLAAEIPGPMDIDGRGFGEDPLVHALFSGPEQIADMLGRSQAVRDFLARAPVGPGGEFFGLLGMRRHERTIMGAGLDGDRLRREVPQKLLYFSDHTLLELNAELVDTRRRVGELAFDSLAKSFAVHLAQLREARQDLHTQWEAARAAPADALARSQTLGGLERLLAEAAARLTPERVLAAYLVWLADPAAKLRLDCVTLSVDRLGVLAGPGGQSAAQTISFRELVARDRRRWILVLVRVAREEALQALRTQQRATRYLLI